MSRPKRKREKQRLSGSGFTGDTLTLTKQ